MHKFIIKKSGLSEDISYFLSAKDTLDHIARQPMENYLIMLDINMPGMSGWDLLDQITEKNQSGIYVVIVSSSVNFEDHHKARTYSQVIGFIEKPLTDVKIQALMESHLYKTSKLNG
jgi:CheY-like chemotaxis protein